MITRSNLVTLALCCMLHLPTVAYADKVDDYLLREMKRNHIPGVAVAVIRSGKVVKLKAYGKANLEWDTPVSPDTAFPIASATKPITGTALMLLVQEGKIALDVAISRYLPNAPSAWRDITVRHLANHSSGIPDNFESAPLHSAVDVVQAASKLPLTHAPGTKSSYGLTGYSVLQHLIERVSGQAFPAFVQSRLLLPLGMQNTQFDEGTEGGSVRTAEVVRHRTGVYEWNVNRQKAFWFLYPSRSYSAGGLYSSVADLAKWITALDAGRILIPKNQEQLWTAAKLTAGKQSPYGLGWVIGKYRGRRTAGHSGGPALADVLRFVDDRLTIIVLANQQKMYPYLAQGVADLYVPAPTVMDVSIPDNNSEITASLKAMLLGFAQGTVDVERFTPESRASLVGAVEQFAMPFLRALGPVQSLTLLEEETEEPSRRIRRYRAWYGKKPVLWRFELNQEGKLLSMEPTPE